MVFVYMFALMFMKNFANYTKVIKAGKALSTLLLSFEKKMKVYHTIH